MKPKDVKRECDILHCKADNVNTPRSWILFNRANEIVICNQNAGEEPTGKVFITRRDFQKFVDWWEGK